MTSPRIAIVGLGAFGRLHAETLLGLGGKHLVALVDRNEDLVRTIGRERGITHIFASMTELIAASIADAVIVATRAETHVSLACEALSAGLAVFLEKPAAENTSDLQLLISARDQTGLPVMVNHICLFHSSIAPVLHRIEQTGFRAVHFIRHRPASLRRRLPEMHPVHLLMVHDLYLAARMVGGEEPSSWHFEESRGPGGGIDMTWAMLRWPQGKTATFHCHCVLPPAAPADGWDSIEIFGNGFHSHLETNPAPWVWNDVKTEWPIGLGISSVRGRSTGMLAEAQRAFLNVLDGEPVPVGCRLEDALQVERWTERFLQKNTFL